MNDFELRLFAYEKAHKNIDLAKHYLKFLNESSSDEDREIRIRAIDSRNGKGIKVIKKLYLFLRDGIYE